MNVPEAGEGEPLQFHHDPQRKQVREFINNRFAELEVDPIDVFVKAEQAALTDLRKLLVDAGMEQFALERIENRKLNEFRSVLTVSQNVNETKVLTEHGTGNRAVVVPVKFLGNVTAALQRTGAQLETRAALHYGMRMCLMYGYGLLVYDEIDPLITLDSDDADRVSKSLALNILQTGMGDQTTGDGGLLDLPPSYIPHYMSSVLPLRFASAMMYADMERALRGTLCSADAQRAVEAFHEERVTAVNSNTQEASRLAIPGIEVAFAYPLYSEDLRSIIRFGSVLAANTRALRLVPPVE